ncbi:MAG: EAL domain-containing protein [Gammaproteobacteria bacterium]|nr:EAL domain-containing protein [Gammaproteobacteria bacterium]
MSDHATLKRLLILDDDADFRKLLQLYLRKMFEGVEISEYDPVARGVPGEDFDWSSYDVLILDYYLCIHNVTGLDILQANRKNRLFPATIMLTGAGSEEVAVRAIKAGVYDYLRKEKLDKDQLRRSILDAFEKHKVEQQRLSELTNQSNAFNKALFYQELEQGGADESGRNRVLLLLQLDGHKELEDRFGIIMRDNVVRHLAKQSFDVFQLGECNPHITRLSDDCVALIIDDPESEKTLEFNVSGLCTHLQKQPYKFDDRKIRFTVSVGVVPIPREGRSADLLISRARQACALAAQQVGNSFHILEGGEPEQTAAPAPVEITAQTGAVVPETIELPQPVMTVAMPLTETPGEIRVIVEPPAADAGTLIEAARAAAATAEPEPAAGPEWVLTLEPETTLESARAAEPELTVTLKPESPSALPPENVIEPPLTLEPVEPKRIAVPPAKPWLPEIEPEIAEILPVPGKAAPAESPPPELLVTVAKVPQPPVAAPRPTVPEPQVKIPEPAAPPTPTAGPPKGPATAPAAAQEPSKPTAPPVSHVAPAPKPAAPTAPAARPAAAAPAPIQPKPAVTPAAPRPVPPQAAPAAPAPVQPKPAVKDEAELDDAQLDPAALKIKKAFDEKRVVQAFQPVMPLFNTEGTDEREVFKVRLQLVDRDGKLMQEDEIYAKAASPTFRKFIDRWLLREIIGRLVTSKENDYFFVLRISGASLADPALFNWLRKLLAGLEQRHPGRNIALELTAGEYSGQEKKAAALMDYLHKSHGFNFVLAGSSSLDEARKLTASKRFNLLRVSSATLAKAPEGKPAPAKGASDFEWIKAGGIRIIVDHVEDSTTLTNIISAGADYAMGNFIGEPVSRLGDTTNVESFEIT